MQSAAPQLGTENIFINILLGRHMHKKILWLVQGQKPKKFEKHLDSENNQIKPFSGENYVCEAKWLK